LILVEYPNRVCLSRGIRFRLIFVYSAFIEEYPMKTSLKIDGMSCEHCVKHVKEALEAIKGVTSAQVTLKEHAALVEHEDGVGLEALKAAVVDAGYEVA
jgi:copper chaperone CopZ